MTKRVLAFLMVIAIVFSLLPTVVVAETTTPGYTVTLQKAHNQTENKLAVDVYLQANVADQAAVTGYQFTVEPAEGLAVAAVEDATGNDGIAGASDTFLYSPTLADPIAVGTSRVLVATIVLTGETLPAVNEALSLSKVTVSQEDGFFSGDEADASAEGYKGALSVKVLADGCAYDCAHGEGEWTTLPAATNGVINLSSGNYYLDGDVNATLFLVKDAKVNLCLNGYDVIAPSGKKCIMTDKTGVELTICDCSATGEGADYTSGRLVPNSTWGGAIDIGANAGATVTMLGGTIDGTATDSVAASGAGNGVYLRTGNNKFTAKGVKFVGLEGYAVASGAFYGPIIFRGEGTEGYFENCTFVDCGTAIIDANSGTGDVDFAPVLTVKDCVITDSQAGAHAIDVKHKQFASVTIEGDCKFDVPVYIADGEKPVTLNLGENAEVEILTATDKTAEELGNVLVIPEGGALNGTVVYENAGAYLSYKDGAFSFSSHQHDNISFKVWNDPTSLPTSGDWYLETDVNLSRSAYSITSELNLDLNGHTIRQTKDGERIFTINNGGTLSIYDCKDGYDAEGNWTGGQITGSTNRYGVIYISRTTKGSVVNLYGGRIAGNGNNAESGNGGAIYIQSDNTVKNEDGSIKSQAKGGTFNMYGGEIYNNVAGWAGAAISTWGDDASIDKEKAATINIYGGKIHGNTTAKVGDAATGQGTIYLCNNATLNIEGGVFENNSANTKGGAIYSNGAKVTVSIKDAAFKNNSVVGTEGKGGALAFNNTDNVVIENCTFEDNTATETKGVGGALYFYGSTNVTVTDCTFKGNQSKSVGGALWMGNASTVTVKDCTVTENESTGSGGGGIYIVGSSTLTLDNTVVTNNNNGGTTNGSGVYVTSNTSKVVLKGNTVINGNKVGGKLKDHANLYFQMNTKTVDGVKVNDYRTNHIYVNELGTKASVIAYYANPDITAPDAVKVLDGGSQTDWDCGMINFGTSEGFQDVGRVDGVFTFGHIHTIDGKAVTFQPLDGTAVPTDGGYYYLTEDITANWTVDAGNTVNLCFYGHNFKTKSNGRAFVISGGTVNVYDCTAYYNLDGTYVSGGITGPQYQNYGGAIRVEGGTADAPGALNWYGGAVYGCTKTYTATSSGLVMFSPSGTYANIHWYDGAVHDNVATNGGANPTGMFCLQGTVNLTIDNIAYYNNVNPGSGGIYNSSSAGITTVNGGNFWNNEVGGSGAVFHSVKTLIINGGNFYNNTAAGNGGVINSSTTTINGGKFYDNSAKLGGVVYSTAAVNITGGEFCENHATEGGVAYMKGAALTISDGSFHDNVAGVEGSKTEAGTMGQGGIIYTSGNTTITGGSFENNIAYGNGGTIIQYSSGNVLTITGTAEKPILFKGNKALRYYLATEKDGVTTIALDSDDAGMGGAIKLNNGTITTDYVTFEGNSAYEGGAYCLSRGTGSKWITTFNNTTFKDNSALVWGGAIAVENGTVSINGSTFENNTATTSGYAKGGAIYLTATGSHKSGETTYTHKITATIDNCDFLGNDSASESGAISPLKSTTLTVTNSDFEGNTAVNAGGAVRTENAATTVTFENCNFTENAATNGNGGALGLRYIGTATVTGCTFTGNTAAKTGGVFYINGSSNTSKWNITGCTFTGNQAGTSGGVLYMKPDQANYGASGKVTFTNCVMTGNAAANKASAIYVEGGDNSAILTLDGVTIKNNHAALQGAVYAMGTENGELILKGATVIADNTCDSAATHGTDLLLGAKTVDGQPSNIKVDASGLTEGAKIGVALTNTHFTQDPVFTKNGAAAQKAYFFSAIPDTMVLGTKLVGESEELCFYRYIDENGTAYATTQAYVDAQVAAGATKVVIPGNTAEDLSIAENLIIDLNGKNVDKIVVAEGKTLKLTDSKTDDYNVANGVYGKTIVEGAYESYFVDTANNNKRYVVIANEDGTVSAHRVYLAINNKLLRTANRGVGFKAIYATNQVAAEGIEYGIELSRDENFTEGYVLSGDFTAKGFTAGVTDSTPNQRTAVITDVLVKGNAENQANAETTIYGRPYMIVNGVKVTGNVVETSLLELAQYALESGNETVKATVNAWADTYGVDFS